MNLLLKSAKIIDSHNGKLHSKKRDILIKNGVIDKIAVEIAPENKTETVSLTNLHISPGWFDSGVSFGEPGFEERETIANGLQTAAKSGFTDIVLNPNTHPVPDSGSDIVFLRNAGKGHLTDLHPLGALTVKAEGNDLAELYDMKNTGAVGFYDFKHPIENANLLKIALQYVSNFGGLAYSFPMDTSVAGKGNVNEGESSVRLGLKGIPALAEELRIVRDLFILEYTEGKLHIPTISTAGSVKLIADAKKKGLDVSCSVAVHNLFYSDSELKEFDAAYKVLPPLRTKKDMDALTEGLRDGIVDFVTSDHIPMNIEKKEMEFENAAFGSIGLESAFGSLNRIFGMETAIGLLTKGRERYGLKLAQIKEGEPADLTLFDPDAEYRFDQGDITSSSKNSMFLGAKLKGRVYGIINNGQILI
ncbi:dihydroorotase [Pricia sp. S334]|uniref:Dihydroorotase n=1 Tax=Pricia mediterranea TaxID=3076079 RepID=A0ABU3L195_9FLAO|nr:dihydroorotase [Pricia sp. S334]MDT7827048.1 dihydroorotase [Pricia sp. S334]